MAHESARFLVVAALLALQPAAAHAQDSRWSALGTQLSGHKVAVQRHEGSDVRGDFVSIGPDAIVVRNKQGEQSVARTGIRRIGMHDSSRRTRNGILGIAIGAAAGAGIGLAVCPHCANEGNGGKFVGPGVGIGAAAGALALLAAPYRTVYEAKKR